MFFLCNASFSGLHLPDVPRCQITLKPKNVSWGHEEILIWLSMAWISMPPGWTPAPPRVNVMLPQKIFNFLQGAGLEHHSYFLSYNSEIDDFFHDLLHNTIPIATTINQTVQLSSNFPIKKENCPTIQTQSLVWTETFTSVSLDNISNLTATDNTIKTMQNEYSDG